MQDDFLRLTSSDERSAGEGNVVVTRQGSQEARQIGEAEGVRRVQLRGLQALRGPGASVDKPALAPVRDEARGARNVDAYRSRSREVNGLGDLALGRGAGREGAQPG